MIVRLIYDFFDRIKREKLRKHLLENFDIPKFHDADFVMADRRGFYKLQMTDKIWQNLFELQARFCQGYEKVLDVGCGPYELMAVRNDKSAVGVDVSKAALKKLKSFGFKGHVVQADCSHLPFSDLSFDCVVSNQVIEHMLTEEALRDSIEEMQRLSRRVMIITPNAAYCRKIYDPSHFFFFTTRSLKRIIPKFEIYAVNPPYNQTLNYYLQYDSPRIKRIPIIGKTIFSICVKIDSSKFLNWLNKKLWPGSSLVAIKIDKEHTCS